MSTAFRCRTLVLRKWVEETVTSSFSVFHQFPYKPFLPSRLHSAPRHHGIWNGFGVHAIMLTSDVQAGNADAGQRYGMLLQYPCCCQHFLLCRFRKEICKNVPLAFEMSACLPACLSSQPVTCNNSEIAERIFVKFVRGIFTEISRHMVTFIRIVTVLLIKPTWCTDFLLNMFIAFLYMFRATMCPSSGENTLHISFPFCILDSHLHGV